MDDYDGYLSVGNSGFTNGVQVIVIDQLYPVLTGRDTYAELLPLLTEGADRKAFDQVLEKFCQEIPGTMSVSYEQTDQQLEESFAQIPSVGVGPNPICRAHWRAEHHQYSLYQYSHTEKGDWHPESHWNESEKPL